MEPNELENFNEHFTITDGKQGLSLKKTTFCAQKSKLLGKVFRKIRKILMDSFGQ